MNDYLNSILDRVFAPAEFLLPPPVGRFEPQQNLANNPGLISLEEITSEIDDSDPHQQQINAQIDPASEGFDSLANRFDRNPEVDEQSTEVQTTPPEKHRTEPNEGRSTREILSPRSEIRSESVALDRTAESEEPPRQTALEPSATLWPVVDILHREANQSFAEQESTQAPSSLWAEADSSRINADTEDAAAPIIPVIPMDSLDLTLPIQQEGKENSDDRAAWQHPPSRIERRIAQIIRRERDYESETARNSTNDSVPSEIHEFVPAGSPQEHAPNQNHETIMQFLADDPVDSKTESNTVEISIGRIHVELNAPAAPSKPVSQRRRLNVQSLDDYLKRRSGRGE